MSICKDPNKYYPAVCLNCGWIDCSEKLYGGGYSIALEDYEDARCPNCDSTSIEEMENNEIEPHSGDHGELQKLLMRQIELENYINSQKPC